MTDNPPVRPVLVVDDEEDALKTFEIILRTSGFGQVVTCQDGRQALHLFKQTDPEAVILDLGLPHIPGETLLGAMKTAHPEVPVVVVTAKDRVDTAVDCMMRGAFDYLVKPTHKGRLVASLAKAVKFRALQEENLQLAPLLRDGDLRHPSAFEAIITDNPAMKRSFRYIESIADSPLPILIQGETGVGKELTARAVHEAGRRRPRPFVPVNVAGLDEAVFSDTLFGHVKGAFTDAAAARPGLVEKAAAGTLFLDEIGDLAHPSQVKLLRLIQEMEYLPLGADKPKTCLARIVTSTNQILQALQKAGRFRQDLYYRLRPHHLTVPPLRERPEDLEPLLRHFLAAAARDLDKPTPAYPGELVVLLTQYPFPGNVRELRGMVYDAVGRHSRRIISMDPFIAHIDAEKESGGPSTESPPPSDWLSTHGGRLPTFDEAQRRLALEAMQRTDNNQSMAARLLGISRNRLRRLLKAMGTLPP